MKRSLLLVVTLAMVTIFLGGCGSVCDDSDTACRARQQAEMAQAEKENSDFLSGRKTPPTPAPPPPPARIASAPSVFAVSAGTVDFPSGGEGATCCASVLAVLAAAVLGIGLGIRDSFANFKPA